MPNPFNSFHGATTHRRLIYAGNGVCICTEHVYGKGAFTRTNFAVMAERLARLKGRFILSINDHPEIRATFAAIRIEAVETTHTVSKDAAAKAGELIITSGGF